MDSSSSKETQKRIFSQIYDQHIDKIYRFIFLKVNSEDAAKDICSETFLKTWKTIQNGKEINDIKPFLYKVARNLLTDFYRKKPNIPIPLADCPEIQDSRSNLAAESMNSFDLEQLKTVLAKMQDNYREVITLHYIEDYSVQEVASIIGKREGTARVMLHRALKTLRSETDKLKHREV